MSTKHVPDQIGDLPKIGRPANSALLARGITELAAVAELGERELLAMHGVGPKAIRILRAAMTERDLELAP